MSHGKEELFYGWDGQTESFFKLFVIFSAVQVVEHWEESLNNNLTYFHASL